MALFTGFVALGTGLGPNYAFIETSGGSYARVAANLVGAYNTGVTQTLSTFAAATAPPGVAMRLGAIFDASTGGNMLCYWEWAPVTQVGTALPSTVLSITLLTGVISSMLTGNDIFQAGSMIGFANGQPLVLGVTVVNSAGTLAYEPATASIVTNPLFTVAGINVGRFDAAGNFFVKGSIVAASSVVATTATAI